MASNDVAVRPRRSAFAAAFLSFLLPGLGHAYLGRWLRALLWAAPVVLVIAGLGGLALTTGISDLAGNLFDPEVLTGVIVFLAIDFFYRLFAVLDAYRLATDPTVGSTGSRMLSTAGLVAVVVVLVGSHVAVAQPVFFASDTLKDIENNAGDDSEIVDLSEIARNNPDFVINTEDLEPGASPRANGNRRSRPTATPELAGAQAPPTKAPATVAPGADTESTEDAPVPEWDGKGLLNILLIGHDGGRQGRGDGSLLTDTMITVSVDPTTGRVAMISLPRDASGIPLPRNWAASRAYGGGKYNNKINTLYTIARGSPGLFPGSDKQRGYNALMGALGELYGLKIDYYVAVDLNSFRSVVNALGGVVVDVQLPVYDASYGASDGRGKLKLYQQPGIRKMNGQETLAYARSRHATSDFDRSARQQRVITSVREQTDINDLLRPGVINDLIKLVRKDVKTNIPTQLVPKMLSLAQKIDFDRRENLVLGSSRYVTTCYPCGSSGLWMLKTNPSAIKKAVQNVFSTSKAAAKSINAVADEGAVVHVLNGAGGPNTKSLKIASGLAKKGVNAVVPPVNGGKADNGDYSNAVITFYNGAEERMPDTAKTLKRIVKDKQREILSVQDPEAEADIVVTVGSKTKP